MQNIIECEKCKTKFIFSIMNDIYPGGKERETVNCPKCAHEVMRIATSGIIKTMLVENYEDATSNNKQCSIKNPNV